MFRTFLATTALISAAAAAQAQNVTLSGEARMGVWYEMGSNTDSDGGQENGLDLNFAVAIEGDNGLTFGANTDVEIGNGATGVFSGSSVYVEASGVRLTFGNTDGAIATAGTAYGTGCGVGYNGGFICGDSASLDGVFYGFGSGEIQWGETDGDGPDSRARLDFSYGDYNMALSHDRNATTEFGVSRTAGAYTLAFGYADRIWFDGDLYDGEIVTVSAAYDAGNWGVGALLVRVSYDGFPEVDHTNWSLVGNVDVGGGNLYGYVGQASFMNITEFDSYGLGYTYGLGGGAQLMAGIEGVSGLDDDYQLATLGVTFAF